MKKLFSIVLIALMSIVTLNAETTRIYCKMAQSWWTVDGAAVGCHSWGNPGPGTDWPGVRMTPVEGETDLWYIDLDVTKVQNVIFTRVNPSGAIADWGAKTKDLTIPVNGDNLFTITTSDESWGDPGCDGTWSKYGEPVETKYYAKNNWNGAAADDWSWLEMSATNKENFYMLDSVVFGGTGVNINTKEDDTDALWFAADAITVLEDLVGIPGPIPPPVKRDTIFDAPRRTGGVLEAPQLLAGDTIKLFFNAADSTLKAAIVGRPEPAARKEFVFVAGEAADSDPALFAITWGKDGSNETVKMEKQKEALYAADILATVDSVVLVRCATGATEIIWDGEGKNVWNQTANYELCDTMSFGGWTEEGLITLTCETPKPVETKYYAKNNWNGAASEDWSWLEMKKEEDLYVLDSVIFGGTGVNINTKEEDADAKWFDLKKMKYNEQDTIQALDTVRFELAISKEDTVLTAILLGRPEPAARKEFVFVAGEAADSDPAMFAITWGKDGSNETVKMEKQKEALYAADILATVDSVVLVRCATGATEIIWDGEGKNVWNQTANYELCDTMSFGGWTEEGLITLTCETPKPVETKYYAKNNWNGAAADDWSWLEMSATDQENIYMLDSVVFGGTGVNINTKEDDTDALWFAADAITVLNDVVGFVPPTPKPKTGDTVLWAPAHSGIVLEAPQLQSGDTIKLFFNAADSTLKAFIIGRPEPAARKEFVFVAGEAAEANPAMFAITWGKDGSNETVKMTQKGEEALYTANILETVDSVVLVRCASDATEIIWDGEGKNVWNQTANYELCDTMYFESWVEETNLFAVTCEAPKPVETKYYAKNNWNGAAADDWSWLEMSATNKENIYMLDSVVFGGTGVNINTKEDDTDALWFAADAITVLDGLDGLPGPIPPEPQGRDTIPYAPARMAAPLEAPTLLAEDTLDGMNEHGLVLVGAPTLLAGDTIKLFFNAADSTLSAAIVGRPEPCEGEFGILVNETYIPAALNEAREDVVEYMLLDVALNAGDLVQIYDKCNEVAWIIKEYMEDSYQFHVTPENKYLIQDGEADVYDFYFQLNPDKLFVQKGKSPTSMNEIESNATIQKIVRDGHLYIMVNEQVYNVQGIRVQ